MRTRRLGHTGLQVSVVGLGCNNFGMRCDVEETKAVVHRALDLGITFFDTADIYGGKKSEVFLGQALGARRADIVLTTKFGIPTGESPLDRGASRRYVYRALEASLERLGTDYIDLYQLHFPDPETPIEETLRAMDDLVREGKVRYIGCSNMSAWQLVEAQWTSRSNGLASFATAQNYYNLLERSIEAELVPAAEKYGVGILPYFPLASGFLTGKYKKGEEAPKGTRLGSGATYGIDLSDENFDRIEKLTSFASERGHSLLELAMSWLASRPYVSSVIAGATRPEQVEQNIKAAEWELDAADYTAVDELLT